ncbi:MAG: hypothetical protein EOM06_02515 [Sphingobacteriia bacterium]|nr:hypothetical protein [Sphingobacteriia bacterium]
MNNLRNILLLFVALLSGISCEKEINNLDKLENLSSPAILAVKFDITQDNSGLVTLMPEAEGVTGYEIKFGDIENEVPTSYGLNDKITHIYPEGVYTVEVTGIGLTGLKSSLEQDITVSFKAPENLVVTIEADDVNPRIIKVSATADYATVMDIYFGDTVNEVPETVLPGEVAEHLYDEPGSYEIKVIARSGGAATTEHTEIINISPASDPVTLPINFESFTVNYAFLDFGGNTATVVDNPDPTGENTSARVAQAVKGNGAETWAGSLLTLENPIDFSTNKIFKLKVWSPKVGAVVKLKVENLTNGEIAHEVDANTTVNNSWEELQYDFSAIDINNEYQKVVFFFDFGNVGDGSAYYFDDIKLVAGSLPSVMPVQNFEGEPPAFTVFGNIPDIEILPNPDPTGANTTATVAKMTKSSGAETWAGAFFEHSGILDLENYKTVKVSTWSPVSGVVIKLKLENQDASITHEVDIVNTTASTWEELEYDFSAAPAADYIRIVIFFDFGNPGNGNEYYFDEFELIGEGGGPGAGLLITDFEGEPITFTDFGNSYAFVTDNPDQTGINTSTKVAEFDKPQGAETWAGSFFDLAYYLDLDSYSAISAKTWSPKTGIIVKLKLENSANGAEAYEVDMTTTVSNTWEELKFDFSAAPDFTYDRVVIFFDFGNLGDDTTYYIDDLTLTN